jgi:hypothetical protein
MWWIPKTRKKDIAAPGRKQTVIRCKERLKFMTEKKARKNKVLLVETILSEYFDFK